MRRLGLPIRGVHPACHHHDRQAGLQQLRRDTLAEDVELVAQAHPRGGDEGPVQALHQLGAGLPAPGSWEAGAVRRVP